MFGDENVGSLHIPVNDLVVVDEEEAFAHLLHHLLDLPEEELDVDVGEEPGQVVLTEVKHQVERGLVPAVLAADLDEIDVIEQLQRTRSPRDSTTV